MSEKTVVATAVLASLAMVLSSCFAGPNLLSDTTGLTFPTTSLPGQLPVVNSDAFDMHLVPLYTEFNSSLQMQYTTTPPAGSWFGDFSSGEQPSPDHCDNGTRTYPDVMPQALPGPTLDPNQPQNGNLADSAGCEQGIAGYLFTYRDAQKAQTAPRPFDANGDRNPDFHCPTETESIVGADGKLTTHTFTLEALLGLTDPNNSGDTLPHRYKAVGCGSDGLLSTSYSTAPTVDGYGGPGFTTVIGYGWNPADLPPQGVDWNGFKDSAGDVYYASTAPGDTLSKGQVAAQSIGFSWMAESNGQTSTSETAQPVIGLRGQAAFLEPLKDLRYTNGSTVRNYYTTNTIEGFFMAMSDTAHWHYSSDDTVNGTQNTIGYVWNEHVPGTVPLLRFHDKTTGTFTYSTNPGDIVVSSNIDTKVLGYVYSSAQPETTQLLSYSTTSDQFLSTNSSPALPDSSYTASSPALPAYVFTTPDSHVPYYEVSQRERQRATPDDDRRARRRVLCRLEHLGRSCGLERRPDRVADDRRPLERPRVGHVQHRLPQRPHWVRR